MTNIIYPGSGILFMKVGTHAKENLSDIIARKTKEIESAGYALWGYGGNTCHPETMVQPFAKTYEEKGEKIHLCMQEMNSMHFAEQIRADQYSDDGISWKDIHPSINVLGSRFALVIKDLRKEEFELPLAQTRVAIGNSRGRVGFRYVRGRVDKACLQVTEENELLNEGEEKVVEINLVAELFSPYAVYVRNKN